MNTLQTKGDVVHFYSIVIKYQCYFFLHTKSILSNFTPTRFFNFGSWKYLLFRNFINEYNVNCQCIYKV